MGSAAARAPRRLLAVAAALLPGVAAGPRRPTLDRPASVVALLGPDAPGPAAERAGPGEEAPAWRRPLRLASGEAFDCQRPSRAALARDAWRRDRAAARWAPLRHRCHAWREAAPTPARGPPWRYRVCFGAEALAWAPRPWSERQTIGWYDKERDEAHPNGSVTLWYVNGTGGSSMVVRCDCGHGPPQVTAWERWGAGLQHRLALALPSCCPPRGPGGGREPLEEVFARLTSPLEALPCYAHRQGSWEYRFCPGDALLQRALVVDNFDLNAVPAAPSVQQAEQAQHAPQGGGGQGVEDGGPAGVPGGGSEGESLAGAGSPEPLGSGRAAPLRLARARPAAAAPAVADEPPRALAGGAARPSVLSGGEPAGAAAFTLGPLTASTLERAVASAGAGRHLAVEMPLGDGAPCEPGRDTASDGVRHQATVRWVCPASWRTEPPERDGGHSALLAVEQVGRCSWVAWFASLLLCAEERLMPPPAADLRTSCRERRPERAAASAAGGDGGEDAGLAAGAPAPPGRRGAWGGPASEPPSGRASWRRRRLQRTLGRYLGEEEPSDQLPDEALRVGQAVESAVDGARGVVVARHRLPTARLLTAAGRPFQSAPHCLVMAGAGQLPASGALEWGALGFHGRLSYVPEHELAALRGAATGGPPPVRLPTGAEGRNDFFTGFDESSMRFLPSALLLYRRAPSDGGSPDGQGDEADEVAAPNESAGAASELEARPSTEGAKDARGRHRELPALLEELGALSGRLESAHAVAAGQLREQLEESRLRLLGRRRSLRKLRSWLEALQTLGGATPGAEPADEGDIDPEGDFDPELAEHALDEEVAI